MESDSNSERKQPKLLSQQDALINGLRLGYRISRKPKQPEKPLIQPSNLLKLLKKTHPL